MNSDQLIRAATPAATTAAVVGIPADLYHFAIPGRAEEAGTVHFKLHAILLVAAFCLAIVVLAGMALRLGDRLGRIGTAGVPLAFVGTVLVAGNIATEAFWMPLAPDVIDEPTGYTLGSIVVSFGLFALGWLLVGLALGRSGIVPRSAATLLCVGAVIGFTPLPGAYIVLLAGIAAAARALGTARVPAPALTATA